HALAGVDALLAEPVNYVEAADTVMAVDDQGSFIGAGIQILKLAGNRAHRDQGRALDFRLRKFVRLTNVDQMKFFTGVQAALDFPGIYLEGRRQGIRTSSA